MELRPPKYRFVTTAGGKWTINEWTDEEWLDYECEYENYEETYIALRYIKDLEKIYNYPRE